MKARPHIKPLKMERIDGDILNEINRLLLMDIGIFITVEQNHWEVSFDFDTTSYLIGSDADLNKAILAALEHVYSQRTYGGAPVPKVERP